MKKFTIFLGCLLIFGLCACGAETESTAESVSSTPSEATVETVESTSDEISVSEEAESVEEEPKPTTDELFYEFLRTAEGISLKLQVYDQKGMPVKNGQVILSTGNTIVAKAETSEEAAEVTTTKNIGTYTTDNSGYVFISQLEASVAYQLAVTTEDADLIGAVSFSVEYGTEYAFSNDTENGSVLLTVTEAQPLAVNLSVTATNEDGAVSAFEVHRMAQWTEQHLETED